MASTKFQPARQAGDKDEPRFPEDIVTAPLLRISLQKLLWKESLEVERFIGACKDLGFFYLDLRGPGDQLLLDVFELFNIGQELLELPVELKEQYDFFNKNTGVGYKGLGKNVIDKDGTLDRNEFYNVSKDDIFGLCRPWPAPEVLEKNRALIKSFIRGAHSIVTLILSTLSSYLELPSDYLPGLHRLHANSGDQVRFIKSPPQPIDESRTSFGEHTDFGSVTVLFNRLGGLQILPPGPNPEWCYVKPLPNHAIINLGDAMVKFTNGLLRSNIHRVIAPPGKQAIHTRYSLVYFSRPEDTVSMRRLDGSKVIPPLAEGEWEEDITAKAWVDRRLLGPRRAIMADKDFDYDSIRGTEAKIKARI